MPTTYYENRTIEFTTVQCCECGTLFGMTETFRLKRQDDGATFYCPNGHSQVYCKPRITELKEKNAELQRKLAQKDLDLTRALSRETLERHAKEKAEAAKLRAKKKLARVKNGVCPCCNRSFQNLAMHMQNKHPNALEIK